LKPNALGISIISTPYAFGFPVQRIPLALEIPKSHPWYRYRNFFNAD